MHEKQVGFEFGSSADELKTRCDARNDAGDFAAAFDLQAVGGVVPVVFRREQRIEITDKVGGAHGVPPQSRVKT